MIRRWLPPVVWCGALGVLAWLFVVTSPVHGEDLAVYYRASRALLSGTSLYQVEQGVLPFTYPPFAAVLSIALSVVPFGVLRWLWTAGSLALVAWVTHVAFAPILATHRVARIFVLTALALVFAVTGPVFDHLGWGQVGLPLMALCVADLCRARCRWLPRGVLIGVATAIKLTPALLIVYLLITKRVRAAAWAVVSAVICGVTGWLVAPAASHEYWTVLIWHLSDRVGVGNNAVIGNQSLQGALLRSVPAHLVTTLWGAVGVVVLVGGLLAAVRARRVRGELAGVTTAALVSIVVSPVSWAHHFMWLIPALGVLIAPATVGVVHRSPRWPWALAMVVGVVMLVRLPRIGLECELPVLRDVLTSSYLLCALTLIPALAVVPHGMGMRPPKPSRASAASTSARVIPRTNSTTSR